MPTARTDIDRLADLARTGFPDSAQMALKVRTDLLLSHPSPAPAELAAYEELALALIPTLDAHNALRLAGKLARWNHAPATALAALWSRDEACRAALLAHGMPLAEAEMEAIAATGSAGEAAALAAHPGLSDAAVHLLVERGDHTIDLALLANEAIVIKRAALDLLIDRARDHSAYAGAILRRTEVSDGEAAPLFMHASDERRDGILAAVRAVDGIAPRERQAAPAQDIFAGWLALAVEERQVALASVAEHVAPGAMLAGRLIADGSRQLTALALRAGGVSVENATRFLIMLGDDTARSIPRIFGLVALMRAIEPGAAMLLLGQIAGIAAPAATPKRGGRHIPVMQDSATPRMAGRDRNGPARRVATEVERASKLR